MLVGGRSAPLRETKYGKLHLFQEKLIDALLDPGIGSIRVEAPVGVGKTTAIRKAVEFCKNPIVATFPTTILVRTQAGKIAEGGKVFHWPRETKPAVQGYDLSLIEYTSQSLLDLIRANHGSISTMARGEMLGKLFNLAPLTGGKSVVLTTPDVLWLIYTEKYKHSKRLRESLANSIVFFDEFHCYSDLANFYKLLQKLGEGMVAKVVLMSATPFMREDIVLDFRGEHVDIRFEDVEDSGSEARTFNYPLDVEVVEVDYRNIYKLLDLLKERLGDLPRPTAVIFDSIFRLMQVEPYLTREFPSLHFYRYDGLKKDDMVLKEDSIVLGTSSIEVGIDMDFASLVCEGSSWTTAIQRLGRVGRRMPGQALLLSDRSFKPYRPEYEEVSRSKFEDILREYLPDPRTDWTSGELFRGDAPSFLLIDAYGHSYIYGPGIFSMYEIDEYDNCPQGEVTLKKTLQEMRAKESEIPDIMLRLTLFPVAGIVKAKRFRKSYVPVRSLDTGEDEWVVHLKNGESYYFQREVADDWGP